MEPTETPNQLLRKKYNLHKSPEVEAAARRTGIRTGKKLSLEPNVLIQNYLDRFKEIVENKDPEKQERGMRALKTVLYDKFVLKPEEIPDSYFKSIQRRHREEGYGDVEIPEELRQELARTIITDQKNSLDNWIDYLASPDAKYPDWLKYFAFRSILKMGRYDKEKKKFTERYGKAVSPFPNLNREALAYVFDAIEKKYSGKSVTFPYDIRADEKEEFNQFLQKENFAKLYAWTIERINPVPKELLQTIVGEWVKYPKGSDYLPLVKSLEDYATGWCIRGEATAKRYFKENDLEVFYSLDQEGKPKIPRVVIVRNNDYTTEVRGIAEQENLDPYIGEVVQEKLEELPDGKLYEKKVAEMKLLTEIERKMNNKQELTKDELIFLYEINNKIEGFGYQRDPRIGELRGGRNPDQDMLVIFDCELSQIARSAGQINKGTKAYVGSLESGIFTTLQRYGIEHIYTKFPEGKIRIQDLGIGGRNEKKLEKQMKAEGINIFGRAKDVLRRRDFTALPNPQNLKLVRLKVSDLDFTNHPTTDQIYAKVRELGLELCPAEVGPHLRLKYKDQPMGEWFCVGMKQIADSSGRLCVFRLERDTNGLWLRVDWANPDSHWFLGNEFVFSLRK